MDTLLPINRRNIVLIGASAGGVESLQSLFAELRSDLNASFFVVLHIPAHSPSMLERILQAVTSMHVTFAHDGQPIMPDTVYVSTPDRHLMVERQHIRITRGPKECRVRPSIDVLFRSAALAFGPRAIGVILTGNLDDGTAGLWQIKDRKGLAFVQDPEEAMYRSMPDSAIEHVDVDCIGSIKTLVAEITREIVSPLILSPEEQPRPGQLVENLIAMEGNGMQAGVMELGKVSKFTCPECHGVLVQIEEGKLVRFRCHTGHAYSFKSLLSDVNEAIDTGLWDTIRAVEERILLLRQFADDVEANGDLSEASRMRTKADLAEQKYQPLRGLVLDEDFFSSD
jgi:two-component system chemotaxis response regulator CheB